MPKKKPFQSPTSAKFTPPRSRLFCTNCDSSETDVSNNVTDENNKPLTEENKTKKAKVRRERSLSEPDLSRNDGSSDDEDVYVHCLTSTPACVNLHACTDVLFTPEEQGRRSMSPITRSTQRMCKAMQVMGVFRCKNRLVVVIREIVAVVLLVSRKLYVVATQKKN